MSFWPFGQNISNSNINKILEEYFSILHKLEEINPNVAKSVRQSLNGAKETLETAAEDPETAQVQQQHLEELMGSPSSIQQSGSDSSSTSSLASDASASTSASVRSSSESSSSSSLSSSKTDLDEEDIQDATAPLMSTSIEGLNSSFINRLLNESELLNELTRQNSSLLDFICFGFFYEEKSGTKVQHLEYLISQLMHCIDKISPLATSCPDTIDVAMDEASPMPSGTEENAGDAFANESNSQMTQDSNYLNRATIISEIFSLDIWLITESLVNNQSYLGKIWSIINHPNLKSERSPLVPIFLKINQNFLVSRQDQYLNFVRLRTKLVDDMLQHISISLLMDFFLKCIATDKVESPTGLIELVNDQQLIPKCLDFLNNDVYNSDIQACAGDFLKALIAISANAPLDDMSIGPNTLTRQLASQESIDRLLDIIINKRGSALNVTVSIVIELIRKNNSDYDQVNLLSTTIQSHPPSNHDPIYLGYLLRTFSLSLSTLFQIILDVENDDGGPMLENQLHEKFRPLGFERFKIVELVAELLHCSNMGLMNSKKAERIVRERDNVRRHLVNHLQDAIENLTIEPKNSSSTKKRSSRHKKAKKDSKKKNSSKRDKQDTGSKPNTNSDKDTKKLHAHDNDNNDDDNRRIGYDNDDSNDNENADTVSTTNDDVPNNYDINGHETAAREANSKIFDDDDEDVDETFEIPYVNKNQSDKLRKNPTIGDLFKIQLYDNQFLPKIIELFLTHPWNNFWHNVIFDIIQQIFNGRMDFSYNSFLVHSLFNLKGSFQFMPEHLQHFKTGALDFKLTKDFILQGYQNSYQFYEKHHTNLGYMGHLVLIAEEVVKFSKLYKVEFISPDIHDALQDEEWKFYSEDVLNDTRMMYSKILGGGSYVDDGNGNIVPQLPDLTLPPAENEDPNAGGELINVESLEEQLGLSTESDLHEKLRNLLISNSRKQVDSRNEENGVIMLGPPPEEEQGYDDKRDIQDEEGSE